MQYRYCLLFPVNHLAQIEHGIAEKKRLLDECFRRNELIRSLDFDGESVTLKIANFSRACRLQAELDALRHPPGG
jgi:hypothetical protein